MNVAEHGDLVGSTEMSVASNKDPQAIIIEWIKRALKMRMLKKGDLAAALGIPNGGVTRILKGGRVVQIEELPVIAEFLNEPVPRIFRGKLNGNLSLRHVPVVGDISETSWHNRSLIETQAAPPATTVPTVSSSPRKKLFAIGVGDGYVIYEPYWSTRRSLADGDTVVVERQRGNRFAYILRRVTTTKSGFQLQSEDGNGLAIKVARDFHDDDKIKIIGKVIWKILPP